MTWLYAIMGVLIISCFSFVGALTLAIKKETLERILLILVAFSAGALIGDAFIHLLPEAIEKNGGELNYQIAISIFIGIIIFYALEKFLRWRHCHDVDCEEHPTHLATINLFSDALHNFIDGVIIGISFLVSIPLGIVTLIAVAAHEIPQELGDFGVLIHSGFSRKKALTYNFLFALTAVLGTVITLIIGPKLQILVDYMIPVTAGGFIYIALSDLIPELHKEESLKHSITQFAFMILGIGVMFALLLIG